MPRIRLAVLFTLLILAGLPSLGAHAAGDWNDAKIDWVGFEEGISRARENSQPICLVFYTTWCQRCAEYSALFHDEKIIRASQHFIMIRIDRDANPRLNEKYRPDGTYVPRTYFLTSAGILASKITAGRSQYRFFYPTKDPTRLLAGMKEALEKLD